MPTDFTGVWLNTEIEGNVDEFMEKGMEVGWIQRTFMALAGWGKGKLTHVIEMDDAGKHIRNTMNLPELRVFDNVVDGEAHASPTGETYRGYWETTARGEELILTSLDGKAFDLKRWMRGDRMYTELSYPRKGGVSMIRIFEKQEN